MLYLYVINVFVPKYENADAHEHQDEPELLVGRLKPDTVVDPGILAGSECCFDRIRVFWPDPVVSAGFCYVGADRGF